MMHTLKQMLAEADSQLGRLEEGQAEDIQVVQTFIEDVPRFMDTLRKSMENLVAMTHEVERDYLDALNRIQARMADRRAQMRDAGPVAQPTEETPEAKAARVLGIKEAA